MTTMQLASLFKRQHKNIIRLVEEHRHHFGPLSTLTTHTGRRPTKEYVLTPDQTQLLTMLLGNDEHSISLKKELI